MAFSAKLKYPTTIFKLDYAMTDNRLEISLIKILLKNRAFYGYKRIYSPQKKKPL